MLDAIDDGLAERGYTVIRAGDTGNMDDYVSAAAAGNASRIVVLEVLEWKSDVMYGITLTRDLQLSVLDASGNLLARSSSEYYGKIGPGSWASTDDNSRKLAAEFSKTVEELFKDEKVRKALL